MADNSDGEDYKKVDEGWKKKAREEKEALEKETKRTQAPEQPREDGGEPDEAGGGPKREGAGELPPPTFTAFVSGLASQAFMALGLVENPRAGEQEKDLDAARHLLDTLGMLQEKTQGNLAPEEVSYLEDLLYSLRMAYVKEAQ